MIIMFNAPVINIVIKMFVNKVNPVTQQNSVRQALLYFTKAPLNVKFDKISVNNVNLVI